MSVSRDTRTNGLSESTTAHGYQPLPLHNGFEGDLGITTSHFLICARISAAPRIVEPLVAREVVIGDRAPWLIVRCFTASHGHTADFDVATSAAHEQPRA